MAMIEFVRNYSDHSTDRGYQFEFHCDHCSSGLMSSFQPSFIGAAGGLLEAAGGIFGGILGTAGNSAYSIQRAIGGPAHDRALQQAVTEVKQKFRRCLRCGSWVCTDVCWNERASQCTGCTPKYEQEVISLRVQAQVQATQDQLREKAAQTDYVSAIDMKPEAPQAGSFLPSSSGAIGYSSSSLQTRIPQSDTVAAQISTNSAGITAVANCSACGASVNGSKFCAACGAKVVTHQTCTGCGHTSAPTARFCEECGAKFS